MRISFGCVTGAHMDDRKSWSEGLTQAPRSKALASSKPSETEMSAKVKSPATMTCSVLVRCQMSFLTELVSVYLFSDYCTWVPSVHTYLTKRSHSPVDRSHKLPTFLCWGFQPSHLVSPNLLQSHHSLLAVSPLKQLLQINS